MKIYKNGKQLIKGENIAISNITENGTNDFLVDINEDGNRQALRITRDCSHSRITLCKGEEFRLGDIVGDVFVKTWTDGLFGVPFRLTPEFLSEIYEISAAVYRLKRYGDHMLLV